MITDASPTSEERLPKRRSQLLGPFGFRDFRLLWSGLLISNFGTWLQFTALGYLVVRMAPDPAHGVLNAGLLGAAQSIPALLLSPLAGVIADRAPRRRVLLCTNAIVSLSAFALFVCTATGFEPLWALLLLDAVRVGAMAFDAPARQSWVSLLVPRRFIGNAIGLNSIAFNAPSVIAPPIAGLMILGIGIWATFLINAIATLAVVAALIFMKPVPPSSVVREPMLVAMRAGLLSLLSHPALRGVVMLLLVISLLVRPYNALMPAYAAHVVGVDARGLGIMLASGGIGAILGSLATAIVGARRRAAIWIGSALLMGLADLTLGMTRSLGFALLALFVMGMASLSFAGSTNVLIQTLSSDEMRGRAMSVFSMTIMGLVPAGSLALGVVASRVGLPITFVGTGTIALICTVAIFWSNRDLRAV